MNPYDAAKILRNIKDILENERGVGIPYPRWIVKNSGIGIDKYGLGEYRGKSDIERFLDDQLEYAEIVEGLKNDGIVGMIKAILATPSPSDTETILYIKQKIPKNPTPESIDDLFKKIERNVDEHTKQKIRGIYYAPVRPRNA